MMTNLDHKIAENLARVRQRIYQAAESAGRAADDVQLVAVTKYVDASLAAVLLAGGCQVLGESRPQQLWNKAADPQLNQARWHLIGHLQRNKIKRTLPLVELIHSVDSTRLARAIDEQARQAELTANVLLEVNISGDEEKHGFAPEELPDVLASSQPLSNVNVTGLMGMAAFTRRGELARQDFRKLKTLFDNLRSTYQLSQLSMGMSNDFEVAIEEGSTIVRVGSAMFDGLETP